MPDRILPALLVFLVERKFLGDVSVDFTESRSFGLAVLDSHSYKSDIGVWRFS